MVLFQVPVRVLDPDYLAQFFNNKNFVHKLAFSVLEAALFSRKLASNVFFFDVYILFYVGSGSKSSSVKTKSCGSDSGSNSGSTTAVSYKRLYVSSNDEKRRLFLTQ